MGKKKGEKKGKKGGVKGEKKAGEKGKEGRKKREKRGEKRGKERRKKRKKKGGKKREKEPRTPFSAISLLTSHTLNSLGKIQPHPFNLEAEFNHPLMGERPKIPKASQGFVPQSAGIAAGKGKWSNNSWI